MPTKDTSQIKEKILYLAKTRGPLLPVHVAKETNMSILFASAFLSELFSEKKLKISHLKVGSSPLYYLPGDEKRLENYSQHIKGKERDAYDLLQKNKFLKDSEQSPAIRVALRSIKDFAIPIRVYGNEYWKYLTANESEFEIKENQKKEIKEPENIEKEIKEKIEEPMKERKIEETQIQEEEKSKELVKTKDTKKIIKKTPKKKTTTSNKKNEKFFNRIKEYLSKNEMEIIGIEGFSKSDLTLKIRKNNQERILVAYNKKRINEEDIIKANKKAKEQELPLKILSLGEPSKKLLTLIEAIKNLSKLEKIE